LVWKKIAIRELNPSDDPNQASVSINVDSDYPEVVKAIEAILTDPRKEFKVPVLYEQSKEAGRDT